jgi:hypothetical protein
MAGFHLWLSTMPAVKHGYARNVFPYSFIIRTV